MSHHDTHTDSHSHGQSHGHSHSHPYHILPLSPHPLLMTIALFITAVSGVLYMHDTHHAGRALILGLICVVSSAFFWWKSVIHEGLVEKAHNEFVSKGLRLGMALFIASEVMFFFAFFFSYFKFWLIPVHIFDFDNLALVKEGIWPPEGTKTFDPWDLPLLNTVILLLSGCTVTWAHAAVMSGDRKGLVHGLGWTVLLGVMFSLFQALEYSHAGFGIKDGAYAANFYLATGFHGFHVIVGTIFLLVCWIRAMKGQLTPEKHLGFEFAAWYWHFVDVVWLFLFVSIYWLSK
jgi:cytochrome c oxidase subunit 3